MQTVKLGADGQFEFAGLASGPHTVIASVKGYTLAEGYTVLPATDMSPDEERVWPRRSASWSATLRTMNMVETMVKSNVDGLVIKLDPAR